MVLGSVEVDNARLAAPDVEVDCRIEWLAWRRRRRKARRRRRSHESKNQYQAHNYQWTEWVRHQNPSTRSPMRDLVLIGILSIYTRRRPLRPFPQATCLGCSHKIG